MEAGARARSGEDGCREPGGAADRGVTRRLIGPVTAVAGLALSVVDVTFALLAVGLLVVLTTAAGLVLRARQGRARSVDSAEVVDPDLLGTARWGAEATLVQFSTQMCSRCPGVRRVLSEVAGSRDGVHHLDVDLTHRPDLAQHFRVLQTPTTLVLDRRGVIRTRFGGTLDRAAVERELDTLQKEDTRA
ncbi:Thioredoxin [Microbacterium enclense]|uniref:Thioredoxin n=1 Tax=Microbacterium enclense TaxID=993073 RepID=A0A1G6KTC6_9MICO|nr:Thioredoxin [Microbacterium enclense]